jgi:NAD(P)H-dependent FMN reductase
VEYLEASPTWISVDKGPPIVCDLRILAICGSLQAKSKNQALLKTFAASVPPGAEVRLFDGLRHLPHFNPDIEASGVPESVTQWRAALTASDAVLIACPEYGLSLPGVLKNGIDWVIGSGELEQKVVAITAAVAGPDRGRGGLTALRVALSAVRATIVGGEPIAQGPGLQSQVIALVQALVEAAASRNHTRVDEAGALAATHVLQPACFRDTA